MADKTIVLITGGNTGLGFETCKALYASERAYHILLGVRGSTSRADEPIAALKSASPASTSTLEGLSIDIESDESITAVFETVSAKYGHIDVLINNAGADFGIMAMKGEMSTREAWTKTYNTNVVGTYLLTQTLVPLLLKSPQTRRIIFITSGQASLTEMAERRSPGWNAPSPGWPKNDRVHAIAAYRASKVGMNMMFLEWVRLLANDPVKVFNVSPGFLATGLSGIGADVMKKAGAGDPAIGGNTVRLIVEGKTDESAGKLVDGRQGHDPQVDIQPW